MDMQDFGGNDQSNHRVYELENGNKLHLRRVDPYGFIHLSLDKGQLPQAYSDNAYTDWTQARIAAEKYIRQRQDAVAALKDHKEKK